MTREEEEEEEEEKEWALHVRIDPRVRRRARSRFWD